MLWQKLTKAALLGTENSQLDEAYLQKLADLGVDTQREAPLVVADANAMLAQMRKAGFQLLDFQGEMPDATIVVASPSAKALHLLRLMVRGPHGDVLPEYFDGLRHAKKSLPASELPAMLQQKDLATTWEEVEPLLGEDGRWLLRQHPEWSKLLEKPSTYNWQTGTRQERLKMLAFWRKTSPKFALELVQSTWQTESPTDKAAFLALLQTNLSEAEIGFLEACLDDKRKEVRQVAALLLAKIPNSSLSKRIKERASQFLALKNNRLQVELPEEPDDAAQKDGILKLHPDWQGGAKASLLGQVVSRVNPRHWETYFNMPAQAVVELFQHSDWSKTLLQALVSATVFHGETAWATQLTVHLLLDKSNTFNSFPNLDAMLDLLPVSEAHQIAMQQLNDSPELPSQYAISHYLLTSQNANWPDELSLLIINKFRHE
ncbi:MAG: hypothetical protein IT258_01280, partial [Saprospiraceae bacterium]|nr:hypothetical protein [Saprospiraceae bacterium]